MLKMVVACLIVSLITPAFAVEKKVDHRIKQLQADADQVADLIEELAHSRGSEADWKSLVPADEIYHIKMEKIAELERSASTQFRRAEMVWDTWLDGPTNHLPNFWRTYMLNQGRFFFAQVALGACLGAAFHHSYDLVAAVFYGAFATLVPNLALNFAAVNKGVMFRASERKSKKLLSDAFYNRLRERGLPVPSRDRENWLTSLIAEATSDIFVLKSPDHLAAEVRRFRNALEAVAQTLAIDEPEQAAVVQGLIEALPKETDVLRQISPAKWTQKTFIRMLRVKKNFFKAAQAFDLNEHGIDVREILKSPSVLGTDNDSVFYFINPGDSLSRSYLQRAGSRLLGSKVFELESALSNFGGKLTLTIGQPTELLAISKASPVGFMQTLVHASITTKDKTVDVDFAVKFSTRETNRQNILSEGKWIGPLTDKLEEALSSDQRVTRLIVEASSKVRVCESILTEAAEPEQEVANRNLVR